MPYLTMVDAVRRFEPNKRPLKSLSDAIKGKQGHFRQNLLESSGLLWTFSHRSRS